MQVAQHRLSGRGHDHVCVIADYSGRGSYAKALSISALCCLLLVTAFLSRAQGTPAKSPIPDAAYLQKIWDGWATLNAANQTPFYAQGPHTFFDEAPLKYDSWKQFETGVDQILISIKSATFKVEEPHIHPAGQYVWATALIDQDAVLKDGKHDRAILRWTVVFHQESGKWLIVHEHVSRPTE
jgi:ketosteroid isomerase-like protein